MNFIMRQLLILVYDFKQLFNIVNYFKALKKW